MRCRANDFGDLEVLTAPFPYYGGKRRIAPAVWQRFGEVDRYIEPFFGSGAVLLANPRPARSEIVCDLNGFICNFWRSIRHDPQQTAYYADYPTIHHDLSARHKWLIRWFENHHRLIEDSDFYDAKVAGWWCWGMSLWIGGDFCQLAEHVRDKRPVVRPGSGQTRGICDRHTHIPLEERIAKQPRVSDSIPKVTDCLYRLTGQQRASIADWFINLSQRLKNVIVLNRSWESAITPTILGDTDHHSQSVRAVFLDPPYLLTNRISTLYQTETQDTTDKAARDSYNWAVSRGNNSGYRIAYCCAEGDFDIPPGWASINQAFSGIRNSARRSERREIIMFSPACLPVPQQQTIF